MMQLIILWFFKGLYMTILFFYISISFINTSNWEDMVCYTSLSRKKTHKFLPYQAQEKYPNPRLIPRRNLSCPIRVAALHNLPVECLHMKGAVARWTHHRGPKKSKDLLKWCSKACGCSLINQVKTQSGFLQALVYLRTV